MSDSSLINGGGVGRTMEEQNQSPTDQIRERVADARLVYGGALVDETVTVIECIDETAYEGTHDRSRLTAMTSVGADLVPYVAETSIEADLPDSATPHQSDTVDTPRVTSFDAAADTLVDSRACYVVLEHDTDQWSRIRSADPASFDRAPFATPEVGRFAVADVLVAESNDSTAEYDIEVDEDDPITPIHWE